MRNSIRELARRVGVSDTSINNARADGRIPASLFGVKPSGRPYVLDMEAAMEAAGLALNPNWKKQVERQLTKPPVHQPKPKKEKPVRAAKPAAPKAKPSQQIPKVKQEAPITEQKEPKPKREPKVQVLAPDPAVPAPPEFDDPIDQRTGLPHINISRQKQAHFEALAAEAKAQAVAGSHVPRVEVAQTAFSVARQVRNALELIEERLPDQLAAERDPQKIRLMLREEFRDALSKLAQEVARGNNAAA